MTLTKHDLALLISEETGLMQTQAIDAVQKTLDYIAAALTNGDKVQLRNFGVFEVRIIEPRVGRNPHRPEIELVIPARATVKFRAGRELKSAVLKLTPKEKKIKAQ
jgi:nucleoid DNA-binding protein